MSPRIAVLCAGQGAQTIGMGLNALTETPSLLGYFSEMQTHIDFDLKSLLSGATAGLNQTEFTQPALLVTSLLYYRQLVSHLALSPNYFVGFSLGEITALHLSGYLDLAATLSLVQLRAKAMAQAATLHPGSMAAIIGLAVEDLLPLCLSVSKENDFVSIANYNCPGQSVISGHTHAVDEVMKLSLEKGAKRALRLNVSGAFHSPLMASACDALKQFFSTTTMTPPSIPLVWNLTGKLDLMMANISQNIINQVISPVRFQASIETLIHQGVNTFIEIGPGSVLSGLVKKISPLATVVAYNGLQDIEKVKEILT